MEQQRDLLKWLWPFFLTLFVINFTGLLAISFYGKEALHLHFNQNYHSAVLDVFFKYYTDVATTYVFIAILLYIIFKKTWRHFYYLVITGIFSSMLASLIKRSMFTHGHRPTHYFELKNIPLRLVDGVSSQIPYTFPSGHTVLATIICFYLCMQIKNRSLQFLLCFLMSLVAVGRVYLSKHFVIDTIGGSLVGLFCAVLGYYYIWNSNRMKLNQKIWTHHEK
ncbi:MAG TPA: phosphatase PAP2 family protein [Moheibacter sp.]|nr:phosphatase PAP2 family protein [Moheibacter sp.]